MKRIKVSLAAFALLMLAALPVQAESQAYKGEGAVNSVDVKAGKVNLTHGPIAGLNWPGMTMDFAVKDKQVLTRLKPGQKVEFKVSEQSKGQYVITEIAPAK